MGDAKQSAQPGAANGTAEVHDLNAEPDLLTQAPEDMSDAPSGSVDPWPDEKPGISPEEEEMLLKASNVAASTPYCCLNRHDRNKSVEFGYYFLSLNLIRNFAIPVSGLFPGGA